MTFPPDRPLFTGVPAISHGVRFWIDMDKTIDERTAVGPLRPRQLVVNVPLAYNVAPATGDFIISLGVGSINCRVVGYQMWSLVPGHISVDIERSTPVTHAAASGSTPYHFPSIIGSSGLQPSMNGPYSENLDTSAWANREIAAGDMLHFWCTFSDGAIQYAFMKLYLEDTDAKLQS